MFSFVTPSEEKSSATSTASSSDSVFIYNPGKNLGGIFNAMMRRLATYSSENCIGIFNPRTGYFICKAFTYTGLPRNAAENSEQSQELLDERGSEIAARTDPLFTFLITSTDTLDHVEKVQIIHEEGQRIEKIDPAKCQISYYIPKIGGSFTHETSIYDQRYSEDVSRAMKSFELISAIMKGVRSVSDAVIQYNQLFVVSELKQTPALRSTSPVLEMENKELPGAICYEEGPKKILTCELKEETIEGLANHANADRGFILCLDKENNTLFYMQCSSGIKSGETLKNEVTFLSEQVNSFNDSHLDFFLLRGRKQSNGALEYFSIDENGFCVKSDEFAQQKKIELALNAHLIREGTDDDADVEDLDDDLELCVPKISIDPDEYLESLKVKIKLQTSGEQKKYVGCFSSEGGLYVAERHIIERELKSNPALLIGRSPLYGAYEGFLEEVATSLESEEAAFTDEEILPEFSARLRPQPAINEIVFFMIDKYDNESEQFSGKVFDAEYQPIIRLNLIPDCLRFIKDGAQQANLDDLSSMPEFLSPEGSSLPPGRRDNNSPKTSNTSFLSTMCAVSVPIIGLLLLASGGAALYFGATAVGYLSGGAGGFLLAGHMFAICNARLDSRVSPSSPLLTPTPSPSPFP